LLAIYSLIEYDVLDCSVLDEVKTRFTLEHARAERWVFDNTENIGRLVSLQLPTERVPEIVESVQPDSTVEERKPLVGSEEKAYQSYMLAEKSIGECSDRAAYDWVLENGPSEYAVPPFETWGGMSGQDVNTMGLRKIALAQDDLVDLRTRPLKRIFFKNPLFCKTLKI